MQLLYIPFLLLSLTAAASGWSLLGLGKGLVEKIAAPVEQLAAPLQQLAAPVEKLVAPVQQLAAPIANAFTEAGKSTLERLVQPLAALTDGFWSSWFDEFSGTGSTRNCKEDGNFPDPESCNKFYRCEWNTVQKAFRSFEYDCTVGTVFDISHHRCEMAAGATIQPGCTANKTSGRAGPVGFETVRYCIYDLRLSYVYGSPDGVLKRMIGFNGEFPGPTLTCTRGKRMVIRFTNNLEDEEPTSIHFHGIEQNLSPFYDGPQSIAQCPIVYGGSMIYSFQLFQSGTYWYHSHHSYQYVDGAWGVFIIKNFPVEVWRDSYDEDITLSVTDWIHAPAKEVNEINLKYNIFPDVNSSLINARGTFDCSKISPGEVCDPQLQAPAIVNVIRGKRYRIRVLNAAGLATYKLSIDNHKFYAIETDGVDINPSPIVDAVELRPAHRYSLIVTMDQPLNEYWIRIVATELSVVPDTLKGLAILRYVEDSSTLLQQTTGALGSKLIGAIAFGNRVLQKTATLAGKLFPVLKPVLGALQGRSPFQSIPWDKIIKKGGIQFQTPGQLEASFPTQLPSIEDNQKKIEAVQIDEARKVKAPTTQPLDPKTEILLDEMDCLPFNDGDAVPTAYDQLVTINVDNCGTVEEPALMCMNDAPWRPGPLNGMPLLFQTINGIEAPDYYRPIYTDELGKVIRLVINNRVPYSHPWHVHGHTFWVLGHGPEGAGDYNAARDESKLSYRGVRRDTSFTMGSSWLVVQYVTDNPGVWFFHCHISWHVEAGLGVTLIEARNLSRSVYRNPPHASYLGCAANGVQI